MSQYYQQVNYGLTQALIPNNPTPILAKRAPTTNDIGYPLATLWDYVAGNAIYILSSVVNNSATWVQVTSGGGAGVFSTLTVTTGPSNLSGTLTVGGNIVSSTGNITSSTGMVVAGTNVVAETGHVEGPFLAATGDTPEMTGTAGTTIITNASQIVAGGTGAFSITGTTGTGTASNDGFLKFYNGTTAVYVPFFATFN